MINRRHIRIKVMQSVYAMQQSHNEDLIREEKFLKYSINKLFDLYVLSLQLLIEVQKLAVKKAEISKKKYLATKEELRPNTKFIDNLVIKKLAESEAFKIYLENNKINNWAEDDEYVKIILEQLNKSALYLNYMENKEDSFKVDKTFIIDFFREIIAPNEKLAAYYEDTTISWVDDIPFVNTWILRSLNKLKENGTFNLGKLYKDEDDEEFVSDLFRKTILKSTEYDKDIENKTPNWETDRIADIDLILIKLAISEFLYFPSIPNRVTINEYIELAKDYSTEKSFYFINGVLDKLSKEYIEDKRSVKIGRGLL
jgi:N utilization substance protein B